MGHGRFGEKARRRHRHSKVYPDSPTKAVATIGSTQNLCLIWDLWKTLFVCSSSMPLDKLPGRGNFQVTRIALEIATRPEFEHSEHSLEFDSDTCQEMLDQVIFYV